MFSDYSIESHDTTWPSLTLSTTALLPPPSTVSFPIHFAAQMSFDDDDDDVGMVMMMMTIAV